MAPLEWQTSDSSSLLVTLVTFSSDAVKDTSVKTKAKDLTAIIIIIIIIVVVVITPLAMALLSQSLAAPYMKRIIKNE